MLLQLFNFFAKDNDKVVTKNDSKDSLEIEKKSNNAIISDQSLTSGKQLSGERLKNDSEIINKFLNYCNEGNLNEAYNILTDECKEEMYPTIDDFKKIYYDNTFGEKKKSYTIENWMEDTYQVNITEDR